MKRITIFTLSIVMIQLLVASRLFSQITVEQNKYEEYDLEELYGPGNGDGKVVFLGESPLNEATVQVFSDGIIRVYHAPNRYSDKVMMKESNDGGFTWTDSKVIFEDSLIWQYPRRTLIDDRGDVHLLVFQEKDNHILHSVSKDEGKSWTPLHKITDGWIGAIRGFTQTESGRLIFGFHRRAWARKSPFGDHYTGVVYSDDYGKTWIESKSKIIAPVYEDYNGNNYGAVEPNIVQLNDGRIWMLCRTQTGWQFESFSEDEGESWSVAQPSVFHSSNSPLDILKLSDGRIVVTWCNTGDPALDTFGRVYTHRDVLHMAVSDDDGKSWKGFREVFRIPSRNNQNDMPGGDSGVAYPNAAYTKDGKIILVTGQGEHGGGKAMFRISPEWLYETSQEDDFSNGLEKWSCYTFEKLTIKPGRILGPELISSEKAKGGKVLHIRKADQNTMGDGAVWNFPSGTTGELTMRIRVPQESQGTAIALTDHHRHPNDFDGEKTAMFTLDAKEFGNGEWQIISLKWNLLKDKCDLFVDGKLYSSLRLINKTQTGISYLRFRSLVDGKGVDKEGVWIDWVRVEMD
ncbi:exo-alpha-sialidase [Puteibacter caeruleilacunae]|nr:exo-alpha-sialidase [Puteibacter caeruleilacunae]